MSKQNQLIEYIIQDIVDMISNDQNIEYDQAMNNFIILPVFEKLQDHENRTISGKLRLCIRFIQR